MNEIKCPKCGTVFQIDEHDYETIVNQVRDKVFEDRIKEKEKLFNIEKDNEINKIVNKLKEEYDLKLKSKDEVINKLNIDNNIISNELKNNDKNNKLVLNEELLKKDKEYSIEINKLKNDIVKLESDKKNSLLELESNMKEIVNSKEKEIYELEIKNKNTISDYNNKLKVKDEQINYYKDLKTKMSTKMIGESLEQHCYISYNSTIRPLLPNSYFEKDNDVKTGSKGDFVFKDYIDGIEYISIMFEMKNEMDTTSSKHKNEDFFKELDKDRKEKNCEYAVLVSMLESDSELYNQGIVDVSYKYPKMYVIRPQFFIPIITLLVNASKNSVEYKKELEIEKSQNIDISNFEENINSFKDSFGRNYRLASERFSKAIEEIDKSIDHLQKIKDNLIKSNDNLRLANNKAEDLSIRRLTKNSPSVSKMFDDLKRD